jgi:HD-like signal output (HDOD) protein
VACALLTEELAWTCMEQQDLAYTAGLLHDIGRLALLVARPEEYAGLLKAANDESIDVLDRERELFGMDHCEAGRQLAELWHLPKEFHVIAGRHHDAPTSSEVDLLFLVHLGCRFADTLGYAVVKSERTWTVEQIRAALPEAAQSRFHVDIDQMKASLEAELEMFDNPAGVKPDIADVQPEQPDFSVPEAAVAPRGIPYRQAVIGVGAVLAAAILIMLALNR